MAGETVVLVGADATFAGSLARGLTQRAVSLVVAEHLDLCRELLGRGGVSLVIVDLDSLGAGAALLEAMGVLASQVPLVVTSSETKTALVGELLSRGARGYLARPFDLEVAEAVFESILGLGRSSRTGRTN